MVCKCEMMFLYMLCNVVCRCTAGRLGQMLMLFGGYREEKFGKQWKRWVGTSSRWRASNQTVPSAHAANYTFSIANRELCDSSWSAGMKGGDGGQKKGEIILNTKGVALSAASLLLSGWSSLSSRTRTQVAGTLWRSRSKQKRSSRRKQEEMENTHAGKTEGTRRGDEIFGMVTAAAGGLGGG